MIRDKTCLACLIPHPMDEHLQRTGKRTELAHRRMVDGMLQAVLTNKNPNMGEAIEHQGDLRVTWSFEIRRNPLAVTPGFNLSNVYHYPATAFELVLEAPRESAVICPSRDFAKRTRP